MLVRNRQCAKPLEYYTHKKKVIYLLEKKKGKGCKAKRENKAVRSHVIFVC